MSITEFLNARIAEDEEQARLCRKLHWFPGKKYGLPTVSYARVLAECEAKRAIVEQWEDPSAGDPLLIDAADAGYVLAIDHTLRTLAAVYADHPAYLDEWRVGV